MNTVTDSPEMLVEEAGLAPVTGLRLDQARRLMGALYQDHDWFHVLAYTEKGADHLYEEEWVRNRLQEKGKCSYPLGRWVAGEKRPGFIWMADPYLNSLALQTISRAVAGRFAVAASVGVFAPGMPRQEEHLIGLSAFAIDIDAKNMEKLVPGATEPAQVIPVVVALLGERGLVPHALVSSGGGLHVYILIDRVKVEKDEARHRLKETWYRLGCLLGGSTDRFDLASVFRLPGSWNWKTGSPRPVEFVEEYTDLGRVRYQLEIVEAAVADMPGLTKDRNKNTIPDQDQVDPVRSINDHSPDHQRLLDIASELDPPRQNHKGLAELQALSRVQGADAGKADYSRADFAFACRMVELGLPEEVILQELAQGEKASRDPDRAEYVHRTFSAAVQAVFP